MEQNEVIQLDKKKIIIIVASVIAVLVAIYLGISIYFMSHFFWGSKIGNVTVSGKTAEEADEALQQTLEGYELAIKERDGSIDSILGDKIDLAIAWNTKPEYYIDNQNAFAWIWKVFQTNTYKIDGVISWDETKLQAEIACLSAMDSARQIAAIDAKVSEYDVEKGYTLVPSVPGTVVQVDTFTQNIKNCLSSLDEDMDMVETNCYVPPVVLDDNETLLAAIEQLNTCLKTQITYQVGNQTQVLDATTFQPWLSVNENMEVVVDDASLTEYVKSLASKYNTCYSHRKFMTSYNQEITITNSHYGWKVNQEKEKAAIVAEIMAGAPVTRDLNYSMKAKSRGVQDFGNSYVEINLTAQHLFLYVNGQLVIESDLISGNVSRGWDTPTGIWGVTYKTTNATLRGADYEALVAYWIPFAGNVGMHDATYKSDFGGNYYKTDGSHGCVNLPLETAKTIYAHVYANFPVIVYQLPGTESAKGIAMDEAAAMDKAINAIGTVSLQSEATITACRAKYDALSDMAKSYVKKYNVLVNAEKRLAELKAS